MSDQALGSLLSSAPPTLAAADLSTLLAQHYGLHGAMRPLTSERDLNFHLATPDQDYVVKLANPAEPALVTDFQTKALLHLEASTLPIPRVIRTNANDTQVPTPHGLLRVLTYVQGTPQHLTQKTAAQSRSLATMAARLSQGLQGFSHPAADHILQWDLKQATQLRPLLPAIADPDLQSLCAQTLARFETHIAPALPNLRWQVVHNDLNPHNVLTAPENPDQIAGILDFGDMVHTPLICDVAVTAAYQIDTSAPAASLLNFARTYHAVQPLTLPERRLLLDLTATRMLTTIAIASARAARYPDNAAYILRNFPDAKAGLMALHGLDHKALLTELETR